MLWFELSRKKSQSHDLRWRVCCSETPLKMPPVSRALLNWGESDDIWIRRRLCLKAQNRDSTFFGIFSLQRCIRVRDIVILQGTVSLNWISHYDGYIIQLIQATVGQPQGLVSIRPPSGGNTRRTVQWGQWQTTVYTGGAELSYLHLYVKVPTAVAPTSCLRTACYGRFMSEPLYSSSHKPLFVSMSYYPTQWTNMKPKYKNSGLSIHQNPQAVRILFHLWNVYFCDLKFSLVFFYVYHVELWHILLA